LKPCRVLLVLRGRDVAPCAGAWIETEFNSSEAGTDVKSPPARGRGLKPDYLLRNNPAIRSPPARGRGLKLFILSE